MFAWLKIRLLAIPARRAPDFIIGGHLDPYLKRWFIIPRNPLFNVYLHHFLRSDDDRALHDHPWLSVSIILKGCYWEHTEKSAFKSLNPPRLKILETNPGKALKVKTLCRAGDVTIRLEGKKPHRIELDEGKTCWTLFITGPRYRNWGFHCPQGWVRWQDFTDPGDKGGIGKGCDQ